MHLTEQFLFKYYSNGTNTLGWNESTTQIIFDSDIWMVVRKVGENIYMMSEYLKRGYAQFRIVNHPISTSARANQKVLSIINWFSGPLQFYSTAVKVGMC